MKNVFKYYVCDSLTESIVGSFYALNNTVAKKVVDETIKTNEKVKAIGDSLVVYCSPSPVCEYETYNEILLDCNVEYTFPISEDKDHA